VRAQVRQLEEDQKRRARRHQTDVLDRSLVDLLGLLRDVLVVQLGAPVDLVNSDMTGEIRAMAEGSTPEDTLRRADAVQLARERLAQNVAPLLAIEALALSLRAPGRPRNDVP
jgi:DNA polymerase-3 subunit delta'